MRLKLSSDFITKKRVIVTSVLSCLALFAFVLYSILSIDFSPLQNRSNILFDKDGNVIAFSLSKDNQSYRFLTTKDDVSEIYLKMLLSNEDKNFYSHIGVDFKALIRALIFNLKNREITSGGSTLAMQVVKRLSNHKNKSGLFFFRSEIKP